MGAIAALHKKAAARRLAGCRAATQALAVHAAASLAALTGLVLAALLFAGPALAALMQLAGLILVLLLLVALRVVLPVKTTTNAGCGSGSDALILRKGLE